MSALYADVNLSATGTVVNGVAGYRIRVISYVLVATTAVTAAWQSSTPTVHAGPMALVAGVPVTEAAAGPSQRGLFLCDAGAGLQLLLGAAVQVGGRVTYELQPV